LTLHPGDLQLDRGISLQINRRWYAW